MLTSNPDSHTTDIRISELYIDLGDFVPHDDFTPEGAWRNKKK